MDMDNHMWQLSDNTYTGDAQMMAEIRIFTQDLHGRLLDERTERSKLRYNHIL